MGRFANFSVDELRTIQAGLLELENSGVWNGIMVGLLNDILDELNTRKGL